MATTNPELTRSTLPQGYRQGIITAITVLLGFSLAFFRFWGLEAPGKWTIRSAVSTGTLVVAIFLQIIALFRSVPTENAIVLEKRQRQARENEICWIPRLLCSHCWVHEVSAA